MADFWIITTLGQITNGGYLLLVPKRHVSCIGALDKTEATIIDAAQEQISTALRKEYKAEAVALFEHGIVGQTISHAHLHLLPAKLDITHRIVDDFPKTAFMVMRTFAQLQKLFTNLPKPYLLWKDSHNSFIKMLQDPKNVPAQYFRTVAAGILGYPERANWRTMNQELDKMLWQDTVKRMKPYFA